MNRFLGVWDTVGALGLPGPFREESKIFGFNDSLLGDHIERAYQALALNETRLDFVCPLFRMLLIAKLILDLQQVSPDGCGKSKEPSR